MAAGQVYVREPGDLSVRITTATTTVVKATTGVLKRLVIGTTAAGAITITDNKAPPLTLAVFKASMPEGVYELNLLCSSGIRVITAAASDITVTYE